MDKDKQYWLSKTPFELSEPDIKSLLTKTDAEWPPHTWEDLKRAIAEQDLGSLTRYPTDMRKYLLWRSEIKQTYPDISKFIITHRLDWPEPTPTGFNVQDPTPFANPADYKLRRNDWPYAVESDVGHIVVWLKTRIPVNDLGEPTAQSAKLIEDFVQTTFSDELDTNNSRPDAEIICFKNPVRWQSVRTLEHIHVLTKGVDDSLIEKWTGQTIGDTIGKAWSSEEYEQLK